MLTLYKAPHRDRSSSSSDDSDSSRIIPAGRAYITKVNGKLVMARAKVAKKADVAFDLMGEAFGPKTRIIPRRTRSVEPAKGPLFINGVTYVPQLPAPVTYTAPITQQGFVPMNPMPPYVPPQYTAQYPYPYYPGLPAAPSQAQPQPKLKPSPEELNQLQHMDQHFQKVSEKALNALDRKGKAKESDNVVETKTTITIIKHVCAGCGRLRSRKYHHEHPIKEGETPAPDYCRKCQKDASSTSESSDTEREENSKAKKNRKKKKKALSKNKSKKKVIESSSDTETPVPKVAKQEAKYKPAHTTKTEGIPFDPREDYIVVEEDISEDERRPRGRAREKVVVEEYEGLSRPAAFHDSRNFPRRAHSGAERQDRYQNEPKYVRRQKDPRSENRRHRSPSVEYITVEVSSKGSSVGRGAVKYPKKVPVQSVEEVRYDKPVQVSRSYSRAHEEESVLSAISDIVVETVYERAKPKDPRNTWENDQLSRHPRVHEYTIQEVETVGRDPPRHEATFQDINSCSSSRSSEARRRRRRERAEPTMVPWEAPHIIEPETDADVVVVTERFEYRRPRHDEENRRTQEQVDKTTLEARSHSKCFSAEDASKYFQDDWAGVESMLQATTQRPRRSYRRDRPPPSSLSDAESYDYTISGVGNELPHVPDPPSRYESHHWASHPSYPTDDEPQSLRGDIEREDRRGGQRSSQHGDVRDRDRSLSRPRSEHVPGAWEGRSASARTPSPAHIRERVVEVREDEMSVSSKAEIERMAELGARHVTFRSTPSMRSATTWLSGNEESPTRKQSGNSSGWEGGGTGGDW